MSEGCGVVVGGVGVQGRKRKTRSLTSSGSEQPSWRLTAALAAEALPQPFIVAPTITSQPLDRKLCGPPTEKLMKVASITLQTSPPETLDHLPRGTLQLRILDSGLPSDSRPTSDDPAKTEVVLDNDSQLSNLLSTDEKSKLSSAPGVSGFRREHLEKDSKKNWDLFYKRNGNRFFKRRYWTRRQFTELYNDVVPEGELRYLLEIGCGCGDFALTLLDNEADKYQDEPPLVQVALPTDLFIYCCDISDKAIEILRMTDIYQQFKESRIHAFVGNVLDELEVSANLAGHKMDYVSLIFVLSALDPSKMERAVANIGALIKPGGLVFFRDYGIYDKAMVRFDTKSKILDQFYVRQDGTRAYFFRKSEVTALFEKADFVCDTISYVKRETINVASSKNLSRVFVQAKFRRRPASET